MEKLVYYLVTFMESVLSVVGVRATYEQPRYAVVEQLDNGVEIRAYESRMAVETSATGQQDGAAFGRLFRYITGANAGGTRISMTAPVESRGRLIAMTVPVEQGAEGTTRFYLPQEVANAGAPEPLEPGVRLIRVPAERIAAVRFSGRPTPEARETQAELLSKTLEKAGRKPSGPPFFMGYDPPFTVPILRRNEVAVRLLAPRP